MRFLWRRRPRTEASWIRLPYVLGEKIGRRRWWITCGTESAAHQFEFRGTDREALKRIIQENQNYEMIQQVRVDQARKRKAKAMQHRRGGHSGRIEECPRCNLTIGGLPW